jgi:tartrate dehydratase beta subunit/fumarate hydratase class I family protein
MSNLPFSEQFRIAAKDWCEKESAASLLEESKSAVLAQRMAAYGDVAVNKAERDVKSSEEWRDYIERMVAARGAANLAKVKLEYVRMKHWENQGAEATKRAEMKL